jgi:hypothetical protein
VEDKSLYDTICYHGVKRMNSEGRIDFHVP